MTRKLIAASILAFAALPVWAAEAAALEQLRATTLNLIRLLVEEGLLTKEKAELLIRQAEAAAAAPPAAEEGAKPDAPAAPAVVRVPYVPEIVRDEIREQIKQEVLAQAKNERWGEPGAMPDWLGRIRFEGDLRLRYQADRFQPDNVPATFLQLQGQLIDNTTEDRDRLRVRARLGASMRVNEWLDGGLRLTTGPQNDPVSTSQTLGTTGSKYTVTLDRAYLRIEPVQWLSVAGGRIPNPWLSTDLVWQEDLGFEGVAATLRPFTERERAFRPFLTAGAFPLQEVELSSSDKWLYGGQLGFEWDGGTHTRTKFGVAYYDYRNVAGKPNEPFSNLLDYTAPQFRQKGNTLFNIDNDADPNTNLWALAANFRNVNLTASAEFTHLDPVHVVLSADYVRNVGFDRREILARTGLDLEPRTKGYRAQLLVGMPRIAQAHDWQAFIGYRYLQSDAVLDAFTNSDFHLGGTNNKGYTIGGSYGLGRNAWITARWMSSSQIDGPPLAIDVFQLDFNARF